MVSEGRAGWVSVCVPSPSPPHPTRTPAPTSVLDLLLARLGGGHHVGGHLIDGARALLQATQVGAVLVGLHLEGVGGAGTAQGWARRGQHRPAVSLPGSPTLEAATSWAVLAAISCEQTMSSSYLPVCSTTLSADSLGAEAGGGGWPGSPTPWTARHPHLAPSTPPPDLGQHTPVGWLPSPQPWRQRSGLPSTLNSWHKIPAAWLPPSGDRRTGRTSQGCHQGDTRSPGVSPLPSPSHRGAPLGCGSQARCRPWGRTSCRHSAHCRVLKPKRSPGGNLKPRGDLGQRGLWSQAPCRNLSSMAELCSLPT